MEEIVLAHLLRIETLVSAAAVTHRIVANDGSFDTGDLAAGATSAIVQAPSGGLNYHYSIHPTTMFGAIGGSGGEQPPPCTVYCA